MCLINCTFLTGACSVSTMVTLTGNGNYTILKTILDRILFKFLKNNAIMLFWRLNKEKNLIRESLLSK